MNSLVIALVLGAAFSHALWNMLLKKTENRLLMMTAMHTVTAVSYTHLTLPTNREV